MICSDIIETVRNNTGYWDKSKVFDGFTGERKPPGPKILPLLNIGLQKYCATGFNKCTFTIPLAEDQRLYLMGQDFLELQSVRALNTVTNTYYDVEWTSENWLDQNRGATWRSRRMDRPFMVYQYGTRGIGLDCIPTASDRYSLEFTATSFVSAMSAADDVPGQIMLNGEPVYEEDLVTRKSALIESFHSDLAFYAGYVLAKQFGDQELMQDQQDQWRESLTNLAAASKSRAPSANARPSVNRSGLMRVRR